MGRGIEPRGDVAALRHPDEAEHEPDGHNGAPLKGSPRHRRFWSSLDTFLLDICTIWVYYRCIWISPDRVGASGVCNRKRRASVPELTALLGDAQPQSGGPPPGASPSSTLKYCTTVVPHTWQTEHTTWLTSIGARWRMAPWPTAPAERPVTPLVLSTEMIPVVQTLSELDHRKARGKS